MSMKKKSEFDCAAGRDAVQALKRRASNRCRRPGTSEKKYVYAALGKGRVRPKMRGVEMSARGGGTERRLTDTAPYGPQVCT